MRFAATVKKTRRPSNERLLYHPCAILFIILLLSFGLRVTRLDFHSLWYDEATTAYLLQGKSLGAAFQTIWDTSGSETLHPLYYLLLSIWMQIAGSSEVAMRFPSVVFGSCAAVVFALILYLIGGRKALAFGLLLVISPFLMWYSRDARPYALIIFMTGLHLWFYLKLITQAASKITLVGFVATGILCIYSGIFTSILVISELLWSLLVRRKVREAIAVVLVLLAATPLFTHGWRTHFVESSERYYELPKGTSHLRIAAIPQEFLVARSFGPTPDQVRRLPLKKVIGDKSMEISTQMLAIIFMTTALCASLLTFKKYAAVDKLNKGAISIISFIVIISAVQIAMLVSVTGYRLNPRHLAFLFGPLFVLAVLPIACSNIKLVKPAFVIPLIILWLWSCANQIYDNSRQQEDYRSAAYVINNDEHDSEEVFALCHPTALSYYGVEKPLQYLRESPSITCETIASRISDRNSSAWVVLSRPWSYPAFNPEELPNYFYVLRDAHFPGIDMWLIMFSQTTG